MVTPTRTTEIEVFPQPIRLDFTVDAKAQKASTALHTATANTAGWNKVNATWPSDNVLRHNAYRPAAFSAISRTAPPTVGFDASNAAYENIASRINITDLPNYNPQALVTANRFHNLTAAVAMNRDTVTINTPPFDSDRQMLEKAGMLIGGSAAISREAAIHALIKLYELKTKRIVKAFDTVETTPYKDIANADTRYQQSLLKAAEVGFFDFNSKASLFMARPGELLTMGEFMSMLDAIVLDWV